MERIAGQQLSSLHMLYCCHFALILHLCTRLVLLALLRARDGKYKFCNCPAISCHGYLLLLVSFANHFICCTTPTLQWSIDNSISLFQMSMDLLVNQYEVPILHLNDLVFELNYVFRDVLVEQTFQYVMGIQWILLYYFRGVPSWSWWGKGLKKMTSYKIIQKLKQCKV